MLGKYIVSQTPCTTAHCSWRHASHASRSADGRRSLSFTLMAQFDTTLRIIENRSVGCISVLYSNTLKLWSARRVPQTVTTDVSNVSAFVVTGETCRHWVNLSYDVMSKFHPIVCLRMFSLIYLFCYSV